MNILETIKKIFEYSIFDELVESGAERIDCLPLNSKLSSSPVSLWIGDYCIGNDSRVYVYDDSVVVSRKNGSKITKISIDIISVNRNYPKRVFEQECRPFSLGSLKIGFDSEVDSYLKTIIK